MPIFAPVEIAVTATTLAGSFALLGSPPGAEIAKSSSLVEFHGRRIRVDIYERPGQATDRPVILLLHGIGGMLGDGPLMKRTARAMALAGYRAAVVHYFNATGTLLTTKAGAMELAPQWKLGIETVMDQITAESPVAPIGIFGFSLGGFLGAGISFDRRDVAALAVLGGGILEERETSTPAHLPPLLILHGERDDKVPLDRADALARHAREAGAAVRTVHFPTEGHVFRPTAERQAIELLGNFFSAHLL